MDTDLEQIQKPLAAIIKAQVDTPSGETEMFFDNIHLSPLKVLSFVFFFFSEKKFAFLFRFMLVFQCMEQNQLKNY
jgi:hypothetical protein